MNLGWYCRGSSLQNRHRSTPQNIHYLSFADRITWIIGTPTQLCAVQVTFALRNQYTE